MEQFDFSLLQAVLGNIPINDLALEAESIEMCELAEILAKGLIEYFRSKQFQRSNFQSVLSSVILVKCFRAKLWMDSPFVSKQLNDVSAEESMRLADNGVDSISAISNSRSQVLKLVINYARLRISHFLSNVCIIFPSLYNI